MKVIYTKYGTVDKKDIMTVIKRDKRYFLTTIMNDKEQKVKKKSHKKMKKFIKNNMIRRRNIIQDKDYKQTSKHEWITLNYLFNGITLSGFHIEIDDETFYKSKRNTM